MDRRGLRVAAGVQCGGGLGAARGYVLNFDAVGGFVSLTSEQPERPPPAGGSQRLVLADAAALAPLAAALRDDHPVSCMGVIWFRLPVQGDRLNWTWPTFAKVVRGDVPVRQMNVVFDWREPALAEVSVVNEGETTEVINRAIEVAWPERERLVAADALAGFQCETIGGRSRAVLEPPANVSDRLLAPGDRRNVAWFRFPHALDISVRFAPDN